MAAMIGGGALRYRDVALPMVGQTIALCVIAMGVTTAIGIKLPMVGATAMVALFAVFHGHAHGSELNRAPEVLPVAIGFIAATLLLHLAGIAIGRALRLPSPRQALWTTSLAGSAGGGAGLSLLAA